MPEVSRTRATFRNAEFGFLGVWVNTRVQTPRRWGEPFSAGVFDFSRLLVRPLRTSCWMVGKLASSALARQWNTFEIEGHGQGRRPVRRAGAVPGRPTRIVGRDPAGAS